MARTKFCNIPQWGNQYIYSVFEGTKDSPKVFLLRKTRYDMCWIAIKNPCTFAWYLHPLDMPVANNLLSDLITYKQALEANTCYNPWLLSVDNLGIHFREVQENEFDETFHEYLGYI